MALIKIMSCTIQQHVQIIELLDKKSCSLKKLYRKIFVYGQDNYPLHELLKEFSKSGWLEDQRAF